MANEDTERRRAERTERQRERLKRQRKADERVYGKDSMLGDQAAKRRGRIYDIDTSGVDVLDNKQGTDERVQNDGIDKFGGEGDEGDNFDLVTFDVVKDDDTAGQYQWRAEEIT